MALSHDVVYGLLLILSVPIGHYIKSLDAGRRRQLVSTAIGAAIVIFVCGFHGLHSLLTVVVNALIVKLLSPRICHVVSFAWCFGYIIFFRTCHFFDFPSVPPHANAVQLVLTLKMVGLAFEVHETSETVEALQTSSSEDEKLRLRHKYQSVAPRYLDIVCYGYCYIGLLTGPFYKFRVYYDMLHEKNTGNIDTLRPLLNKMKWVPLYGLAFGLASKYFSVKYLQTDDFYEQPLWFRVLYMVPMFFIFRMRFYVAWLLAESSCVTATLGAYPAISKPKVGHGPTDLRKMEFTEKQAPEGIAYNFETIRTIDPYQTELSPTVREGVRYWNMTVQYWFANNVYKRLTIKSGPLKVAFTMGMSAFWHGIHPGYYLSFLTVPPCMVAEEAMAASFRDNRSPRRQIIFDWCAWFAKMRLFDYMCMAFLLLTFRDTMRYWWSVYFWGHVAIALMIAVGNRLRPRPDKAGKTD